MKKRIGILLIAVILIALIAAFYFIPKKETVPPCYCATECLSALGKGVIDREEANLDSSGNCVCKDKDTGKETVLKPDEKCGSYLAWPKG